MQTSRFPFTVVAFDLDGTLVDTAPDLTAALNNALGSLGRPAIDPESVRHMVGHGARALLRQGLQATGTCDETLIDRGFPVFIDHYTAHIADTSRPYPGVAEALDRLDTLGVKLAICTNKAESLALRLVEALGWQDRFAAIVGGDTLPVRKPDPTPLFAAIAHAGGGPAAFVGDSITDTDTARAAALPCIAVTFGFRDRPAEELGATALIDHFDELIPALTKLQSPQV
ncbi:phosphoglycolate phosphatase [Sphingomonas prati]|uniref:Phosphoglycolate phosphatase n=1 Tax=Sphingomonas prati TaxID=1843237 RepID=A0A7W9F275_9SPHN|nr:phosphoglycolate phosphatase [Sphingomonas prati]MBB5730083.1 phosphoglycolate phosphatase [Sphingomonas prati]GGE91350.1 phosphoglycolate phosphatase, bacterial [Sphingomonas prati]